MNQQTKWAGVNSYVQQLPEGTDPDGDGGRERERETVMIFRLARYILIYSIRLDIHQGLPSHPASKQKPKKLMGMCGYA